MKFKDVKFEERFFGTATVGDRGQVVIPAEARKKFGINPGDKMLVMGHPVGAGIVLCKIDEMREMFAHFKRELEMIEAATSEASVSEP